MTGPLSGVCIVELGELPAGAYAARLFADFGAEVIKVEPPGGDASRAFPPLIDGASGWFAWLNFGKKSVTADAVDVDALMKSADVVIDSSGSGRTAPPHAITIDLSWFGESGPYRDYRASDAVCRALAGFVQLIGPAEGPPLTLPDYQSAIMGGLGAFIPAMAALLGQRARRYEVSIHEATIALAEYQAIEAWATGTPQKRWGFNRFTPTYPMGVYPCREGFIGITIVTPAQWRAFCDLMGMTDLSRDPRMVMGVERLAHADALEARFVPRFLERTAEEWFAEALERRLPFAIVPDMMQVLDWPVFRDRKGIVPIKIGERTVEAPGSPLSLTRTPPCFGGKVPAVGEDNLLCHPERSSHCHPERSEGSFLGPQGSLGLRPRDDKEGPLFGIRIIDFSMGWAGPVCTRHLADLGADIVKIEACGYPDWWRGVDNRPETVTQRLYEKSARFNIMNRGKRAITLDLTQPDGVQLAKALVKDADAAIENYSADVLRKLGLDYAALEKINPSIVMVSMAAFGAGGAWRETRAYGSTLEQGSGLPSVGGRAGDPPMMNHLAYGDAVGGLNACSALLVALLHRRRTGEGQFIDLSQVQCMLPFTAAWAIEQSAAGCVAPRAGNRHPLFVPHGVFPCAGADKWVLIAVTDDAMWARLADTIGLREPTLATPAARRAAEDRIEAVIAAWTSQRSPDEAMHALQKVGVAAGAVRHPAELLTDPHLKARAFWQWLDRAYVGRHPQPSPPYRGGDSPLPLRVPAPTLGQHNGEVLGGLLGLAKTELERLERDKVTGFEALPPAQRKVRATTG
ncbi:MAG: CoA transferase [Alphaproteobacteria bacterium]|nr:CoA transferase [Alphaproteobacteria bacterium]